MSDYDPMQAQVVLEALRQSTNCDVERVFIDVFEEMRACVDMAPVPFAQALVPFTAKVLTHIEWVMKESGNYESPDTQSIRSLLLVLFWGAETVSQDPVWLAKLLDDQTKREAAKAAPTERSIEDELAEGL